MDKSNKPSLAGQVIQVIHSIEQDPHQKINEELTALISDLINTDFAALLQLLYRIDVDEKKIKLSLEQSAGEDTAPVIANLIIERQLKKIALRKQFGNSSHEECDEEKW